MNKGLWITGVIIVAVLLGGAYYLVTKNKGAPTDTQDVQGEQVSDTSLTPPESKTQNSEPILKTFKAYAGFSIAYPEACTVQDPQRGSSAELTLKCGSVFFEVVPVSLKGGEGVSLAQDVKDFAPTGDLNQVKLISDGLTVFNGQQVYRRVITSEDETAPRTWVDIFFYDKTKNLYKISYQWNQDEKSSSQDRLTVEKIVASLQI